MIGLIIAIVVLVIVFAFVMGGFNSKSRRTTPPARRRRRDGGFYPVGYVGPYYDDEPLVDGLTVLATIALWDMATREQYGETEYMNQWDEVDYSETQPYDELYEEYVEPIQAEAEEFEDLSADDDTRSSWGGDDSDSYDNESDWDSGSDFGGDDW